MRSIKLATGALGALGALAALTACGGGDGGSGSDGGSDFTDQSAEKIADQSKEALQGLESVRLKGDIVNNGEQIGLDLAVSTEGNCEGSVTLDGASAEVLSVGGTSWFKPEEEFWRAQAGEQAQQIIDLVGDKYVVVPESDTSFQEFCDLDELLKELASDDEGTTYEKGDVSDVEGEETIAIEATNKDDEVSTVYVQVDGEHYPIKVEREGEEAGSITFSEFDEPVEVEAPADDQVVDLSESGA